MNFGAHPPASSLIYPSQPLRISDGQNAFPQSYVRALNHFYTYFEQIMQTYFSQKGEADRLENYRKFQEKFRIDSDKITVLSTQEEISTNSKQAILLRTIDILFRRPFDQEAQLSDSQVVELRPLRTSQSAVTEKMLDSQLQELPSQSLKNSNNSQDKILSLPIELLALIFSHSVEDWQSVGRIAMTCKKFSHIIRDRYCLKKLFETSSPLFPSIHHSDLSRNLLIFTDFHPVRFGHVQMNLKDADLALIASQGTHLESLSLQGDQFTPQGLADLLKRCPRLRSLEFHQCRDFNLDDYVTAIGLYANQLEHLKISDCEMSDQSLLTLSICAPHLRSFEYENNLCTGSITDYALIPFFSRMSQLESIKLTGCPKVTQASLISYINHSIDPTQNILKGSLLKHLNFSYCSIVDASLFNSLAHHCPNLESFELGFAPAQCINDLANKRRGLLSIVNRCSNLRSLKLNGCTYLSSKAWRQLLLRCCHNLIQLELRGNHSLTDAFFEGLSACKNLQHLKLHPIEPANLSQQNLANLKKCTQLETLALVNCKLDEKHLVSYLQNTALKQLQLMKCGVFGSPLLMALAQSCPSLKNLEIEMTGASHSHPFDDASIGKLAKSCPSLTMLTLKSDFSTKAANPPWQLSALSLQHLAEHCTHLNNLTLSHLNLYPSANVHLSPDKIISLFTKRCSNMTHLGLPAIQATNSQILSLILPYRQQLSGLYLANNRWLDLSFLHQLSSCHQLLYLWLKGTSIQTHQEVLSMFPNLNYLDI